MAISPESVVTNFYKLKFGENAEFASFQSFEGTSDIYINAIGYRKTDNLIYGINPNSHNLYSIDASGEAKFVAALSGINPNHHYIAGDVSPDGSQLIIQGGNITDSKISDTELVYIDLTPPYNTSVVPIETESTFGVRCADIAFHPLTFELFGFDGITGKLVIIDPATADIDDLAFPAVGTPDVMASLFFDASGTLYGYGHPPRDNAQGDSDRFQPNGSKINTLYKINTETGETVPIAQGPDAEGNDGCACPYNLDMHKIVRPKSTITCSEVEYIFIIYNATSAIQEGVSFKDQIPERLRLIELIRNPFGGTLDKMNDQMIELSNLTIPPGIDSIIIKVEIGEVPSDSYKNQAELFNLSYALGERLYSDDPSTNQFNDSTFLNVLSIDSAESALEDITICIGDTAIFDATINGHAQYKWNNGSSSPIIRVAESGKYWVEIESRCAVITDTAVVTLKGADTYLHIGEDVEVFLGDQVIVEPILEGTGDFEYHWAELPGTQLNCIECLDNYIFPKESTTLTLQITDENGCQKTDSLNIYVDKTERLYFPNIFSPNDDGVNDYFQITGYGGEKILSFYIYSRTGDLVHKEEHNEFSDQFHGWDGKFENEYLNPGVFAYVVEVEFFDGRTKLFQGDITLIR